MATVNPTEFGKFRSYLWPIHRHELKKFLPMLLIFFLIAFNYNLLRASKDALVVTAKASGAEAIPFIKVWAILPMALLITLVFTRLSNKFSREKVFYWMVGIFLGFFFLFTFVLYPAKGVLHPHDTADKLQEILPAGFKGMIAIFRNWTLTAFYVMSELWGTAIMSVLFWGFANEVTNVREAKRYYGMLGIGANISGIIAGQATIFLSSNIYRNWIPYGSEAWEQSVLFINCAFLLTGTLILITFRYLNRQIHQDSSITKEEREAPSKFKMSLRKNFQYLAQSKYLICIAAIVLAYNLGINLIEVVWKNQIKQLYPSPNDYNQYMGQVTIGMGVLATLTSIFLTGNIIRRTSWTFSAMIPAMIMLVTGGAFFAILLSETFGLSSIAMVFSLTPLTLSVFFGALQNCMARASKYTLFDATKEISFIPLSKECKLKGKAAIDGVGSRLGKSGGSFIHQGLLLVFATVSASTPYIAGIFFLVMAGWVIAVVSLGKQFNARIAQTQEVPATAPPAPDISSEQAAPAESRSEEEEAEQEALV